eukprot:09103_5
MRSDSNCAFSSRILICFFSLSCSSSTSRTDVFCDCAFLKLASTASSRTSTWSLPSNLSKTSSLSKRGVGISSLELSCGIFLQIFVSASASSAIFSFSSFALDRRLAASTKLSCGIFVQSCMKLSCGIFVQSIVLMRLMSFMRRDVSFKLSCGFA